MIVTINFDFICVYMYIFSVYYLLLMKLLIHFLDEEPKSRNGNTRLPTCKLEIELGADCGDTHLKLQAQDAETGGSEVQG